VKKEELKRSETHGGSYRHADNLFLPETPQLRAVCSWDWYGLIIATKTPLLFLTKCLEGNLMAAESASKTSFLKHSEVNVPRVVRSAQASSHSGGEFSK
jgi:hypothetical protein